MLDNLKLQQSAFASHANNPANTPMSSDLSAYTLNILRSLEGLLYEDVEAVDLFSDAEYWEGLSGGRMTCCRKDITLELPKATTDDRPPITNSSLLERGFMIIDSQESTFNLDHQCISETVASLKSAGWPAIFLLLYVRNQHPPSPKLSAPERLIPLLLPSLRSTG
jgi:hypothetical protein